MANRPNYFGILLILYVAAIGWLLVTVPPKIVQQYREAVELGPLAKYAYLVAIGLGAAILTALSAWIMIHLWRSGAQKRQRRDRRAKHPSELSAAEQQSELADNLRRSRDLVDDEGLTTALRGEITRSIADLEAKYEARRLEIVAFGTISSGKSSLLNALAGEEVFRTDVVGGTTITRNEISWPGNDSVVLVDTPGLAEVRGEARAAEAAQAAQHADLVLLVVDGPLKDYECQLVDQLAQMEKRIVVCLNKEDWYDESQREELLAQIREQLSKSIGPNDVIAIRSRPTERQRVHVTAAGEQHTETVAVPSDLLPLADRLMSIVRREGGDLLLANVLLRSRGLIDDARQSVLATLDSQADECINKYMWAAAGATAANPVPLLDLAGGSAVIVKMVLDLAHIYQQQIDAEAVVNLLAQLTKNLVAMVGATAAGPALATALATILKTVPGVGTVAGGLLQGLVQALMTRWIGRVFREYFRRDMEPSAAGFADVARHEWDAITTPAELRKLIQLGRREISARDADD